MTTVDTPCVALNSCTRDFKILSFKILIVGCFITSKQLSSALGFSESNKNNNGLQLTSFTNVNDYSTSSEELISEDSSLSAELSVDLPSSITYNATWQSLDSRPLPKWFDSSKVGIFINWGVHSVPSFGSEWFWNFWKSGSRSYVKYMNNNFPPNFTYQNFASQLTAEFYDPFHWADIFSKSGAKYVVFSSKHHEGYTLWPSKYSFSWNSMDVGPKRDLLGELATAIRSSTLLKFGVYHSLFEWYNPIYLMDKNNSFRTDEFVRFKMLPEMHELVNKYEPEVIWSDGDWEASDSYWKSKEFLMWLYNNSTVSNTVVVNDRWGIGSPCKHGGYYTCQDRYNPGVLKPYKWENAMTLDKHTWGYRRNAQLTDYLTINELIAQLASTVACGGNILINVGPTKEGIIDPIMEERLLQLGQWLKINGDAIYESKPRNVAQNDSTTEGVWYTRNEETKVTYAIVLNGGHIHREETLILGSMNATDFEVVEILGITGQIFWADFGKQGIEILIPPLNNHIYDWAFTLVFKENNDIVYY